MEGLEIVRDLINERGVSWARSSCSRSPTRPIHRAASEANRLITGKASRSSRDVLVASCGAASEVAARHNVIYWDPPASTGVQQARLKNVYRTEIDASGFGCTTSSSSPSIWRHGST